MKASAPTLSTLRCFDAAARLESFTLAAGELCLTPSAVSHQIRTLEEFLGVTLFVRSGRKMLLSDKGSVFFHRIHGAIDTITSATAQIREPSVEETLRISVAPSFADIWLTPRLSAFVRANPELPIQICTHGYPVHFADTNIDCEIRYGHGRWHQLQADLLLRTPVAPVCNRELLDCEPPLLTPADVVHHTLIYTDSRTATWDTWFEHFDLSPDEPPRTLHFDRSPLALEAAAQGLGIALETDILARRRIESGELVAPLGFHDLDPDAYYLVYPPGHGETPRVRVFRHWLLEQLANTDPLAA